MDTMLSGNEYDYEPMSTNMLEDICDVSQSHPSINRREVRYKIHDHFKQRQLEWKILLLSMWSMGKGLHKLFKAVGNKILQALPILG